MAPRPAWRGYLKLSLVTCAVELANATTQADKIHFRTINRATGNPVKRQYVDAESGKKIAEKDEVKGYETAKDEFLLIEEDEIDAVQIEASHTLALDTFVDKAEIDPVYLDTPYYLAPADAVSQEAFQVIRSALERKKMAGIASIVLYRRQRPVVIEPFGKGMLLTTLHYANTVRDAEDIFADIKQIDIDDEMLALAARVADKKKGTFEPKTFEDRYETSIMKLIESRKAGRKPSKPAKNDKPKPSNVVNLFDALKKSLASDGDDHKPAGKAGSPKPAAKSPAGKAAPKKAAPGRKPG